MKKSGKLLALPILLITLLTLTVVNFVVSDTYGDPLAGLNVSGNTITIASRDDMFKLSNCDASAYQNMNLAFTMTGAIDLTGSVGGQSFMGFGSEEYPYRGTWGTGVDIVIDRTLFNGLSSDANLSNQAIIWKGRGAFEANTEARSMLAKTYVFEQEAAYNLPVKSIQIFAGDLSNGISPGNLIDTVSGQNGTLYIGNQIDWNRANNTNAISVIGDDDAGLIVNTLLNGSVVIGSKINSGTVTASVFDIPVSYTVTAKNGSAGGFVGRMASGTGLIISEAVGAADSEINITVDAQKTTAAAANAGGLVGELSGGVLELSGGKLSATVTAKDYAGGVIGNAVNTNVLVTAGTSLLIDSLTVNASDAQATDLNAAGGMYGRFAFTAPVTVAICENTPVALFTARTVNNFFTGLRTYYVANSDAGSASSFSGRSLAPERILRPAAGIFFNNASETGLTISAKKNAGGIFGIAELAGGYEISITEKNADDSNRSVKATLSAEYVGTLSGSMVGASVADTLRLENCTATVSVGTTPLLFGGFVGSLGDAADSSKAAALKLADVILTVNGTPTGTEDGGFGGAAAVAGKNSAVVISKGFKLTNAANIEKGGAIAGLASDGAVIRLSGNTDLSAAKYKNGDGVGQLVGTRKSALIYANGSGTDFDGTKGWDFVRSTQKQTIDDISTYGEVIRLKADAAGTTGLSHDLIVMDEDTNRVSFSKSINYSAIGTADDLALLSITYQTRGNFSADASINTGNWKTLNSKNITFTSDIDLSGTGVTGIQRDTDESADNTGYAGNVNGGGFTVSLAAGEPYGYQGSDPVAATVNGSGRIYRHQRQGLFGLVNGGTVTNLTVAGTVNVDGRKTIAIGSYAASVSGTHTANGLTGAAEISVRVSNSNTNIYAGGLYGDIGVSGTVLNLGETTKVTDAATISINQSSNVTCIYIGGVLGHVYLKDGVAPIINAKNVEIGGQITNTAGGSTFYAGGFLGVVDSSAKINAERILIDGLTMTTNSTNNIGGVLGALWKETELTTKDNSSLPCAIEVADATINASDCVTLAGLVYGASGKWEFGDKAVDLSGLKIVAGTKVNGLGLMIHDGYSYNSLGAIALILKNHWDSSYLLENGARRVSYSGSTPTTFDEFVARTSDQAVNMLVSNVNGVISLKTNNGTVTMDGANINTYVNRTSFGANTNGLSRYYYNLDTALEAVPSTADSRISTTEELLIWSVYKYARDNIKKYFKKGDIGTATVIGGANAGSVSNFDLTGYSYYPVDIYEENLTIQNASFTFCNKKIEDAENANSNKNTTNNTQHRAMHCGILRDFRRKSTSTDTHYDRTLDVNNVSFSGNVGKVGTYSGALICGKVSGNTDAIGPVNYTVKLKDCTLNGITVSNQPAGECSAVLMHGAGSYVSIAVSDLTATGYASGAKAGSSLFGNIGGASETQVNISFTNISLPSKSGETIFTRSSLMNAFGYKADGTGTASYNFNSTDALVTYGAEIDNIAGEFVTTKEPEDPFYYDVDTCVSDGNITASKGNSVFTGVYLPYVYEPFAGTWHTIAVNHRKINILDGCGTYGHPYEITSAAQLTTIAKYINGAGAGTGWEITIATSQVNLCMTLVGGTSLDKVYRYNGSAWDPEGGGTALDDATMRLYMKNAYYDIKRSITLKDFVGLGNKANPFRGSIISSNGSSITLDQDKESTKGFIPYSYGSVIKDLTINYTGNNPLTFAALEKKFANGSFFGGVIGCIIGGDNIIDNVTVNAARGFLNSFTGTKPHQITVGGYIGSISGGGVIFRNMDGKVGMTDEWLSGSGMSVAYDALQSMYCNPIIGRMLEGYAFSEGCDVSNGNDANGNCKNYKINRLYEPSSKGADLETVNATYYNGGDSVTTTVVKSAQGLLVFSAIMNSGAANSSLAGQNYHTNAYYYNTKDAQYNNRTSLGTYEFGNKISGKVRNAAYDHIGDPAGASADFAIAQKDDRLGPGFSTHAVWGKGSSNNTDLRAHAEIANLPYLITKYATPQTAFPCSAAVSYWALKFEPAAADGILDMTSYKNGYLGLSARYDTMIANNGGQNNEMDRVTPYTLFVDGGNAIIKADMDIKEYTDDEYHTQGLGAVFGAITYCGNSTKQNVYAQADGRRLRNLTIKDTKLSLTYYTKDGVLSDISAVTDSNLLKDHVGVGGFAGITKNYGGDVTILTENVHTDNVTIVSPQTAGSLFGNVGFVDYQARTFNGSNASKRVAPVFVNCSYKDCNITGLSYAGGFIGKAYGINDENRQVAVNVTDSSLIVGQNSVITSTITPGTDSPPKSSVGGVIGYTEQTFSVNNPEYTLTDSVINKTRYTNTGKTLYDAVFENVSLNGSASAGGITANLYLNKDSVINKVRMINVDMTGKYFNGGIFGLVRSGGPAVTLSNITVMGDKTGATDDDKETVIGVPNTTGADNSVYSNGGLIGYSSLGGTLTILSSGVENANIKHNVSAGGFVGFADNETKVKSIHDSYVKDSFVDGRFAGGGFGRVYGCATSGGRLTGSNILISNTEISDIENKYIHHRAFFVGASGNAANKPLEYNIAGLSIQKGDTTCDRIVVGVQLAGGAPSGEYNYSGYIAFTDYFGSSLENDGTANVLGVDDSGTSLERDQEKPYASTSPLSPISVKLTSDGNSLTVTGDGASFTGTSPDFVTNVQKIYEDATGPHTPYSYNYYTLTDPATPLSFTDILTSYAQENQAVSDGAGGVAPTTAPDFPLIKIVSGNTAVIKDFLNIVTNGGFKRAVEKDRSAVSVVSTQYQWNQTAFVKTANRATVQATDDLDFYATADYDNDLDRFTLITVTFTEDGHNYNVSIPVMVRRMLEIDFIATLDTGTVFYPESFNTKTSHVLESYGNPITAMLSYTYNYAKGDKTFYGWQNFIEGGGNAVQVLEKNIRFVQSGGTVLPAGTQLTLVDMYDYTVYSYTTTADDSANSAILLSKFTDAAGNSFSSRSIGELMHATATPVTGGLFVATDSASATVKAVDGSGNVGYYRLKEGDEAGTHDITVPEDTLSRAELTENFYLVITVPAGTVGDSNGYIDTTLVSNGPGIPHHINDVLRSDVTLEDSHANTPSTYNLAAGYTQVLEDTDNVPIRAVETSDDKVVISLKNTVTFPNSQQYMDADGLYQRFVVSLMRHINNGAETRSAGFPSGSNGTVTFNIKNPYTGKYWDGTQFVDSMPATGLAQYEWVSTGDNMELPLSSDGTVSGAINLNSLRKALQILNEGEDTSSFVIEAKMETTIPELGLDVIPAGELVAGEPNNFAELSITSQLAGRTTALSYSSTKKSAQGRSKYYRVGASDSVLRLDADNVDQLGINLSDLQPDYLVNDNTASKIMTTAIYDLSKLENVESMLRDSKKVVFKLTLAEKGADLEYNVPFTNAGEYISITSDTTGISFAYDNLTGIWTATLAKDTYFDTVNDCIKTDGLFDAVNGRFMFNINVLVNVDNIVDPHKFSNYKVELNAKIVKNIDTDPETYLDDRSDHVIYTVCKINTAFSTDSDGTG
ncbi:MAG: hypothetical protein Q4B67_00120 [Eubacteriales bacterium]|nr:hypothetical protein [Eubacteriales bacterium]